MPTIRVSEFNGMIPRVHPSSLPDGCATLARNVSLHNGRLTPLREPARAAYPVRFENGLTQIGDAKSLYLWRRGGVTEMLAWPGLVRVATSNIADDTRYRIFVTGETGIGGANQPAVYSANLAGGGITRTSIIKALLPAPVITPPGVAPEATDIRYTYFYQTWVDAFGYMSGPSDPSAEIEYTNGQSMTINGIPAPTGAVARRIWKVISGTETESIQFVWEQAAVGSFFPTGSFTVDDADAGEILPVFENPPADLSWMTYIPGNYYAGFSASAPKTVMFTEVNYPTSWPLDYRYDIRDEIVGLAVVGNSVVALTKGAPWVLSGTSPGTMSPSVMQSEQACVSARSVCVMDGAVFYVSADGICMVSPSSGYPLLVTVVTEKLFSKRDWEALNPSSCIMQPYDGALHCWFTSANGTRQAYSVRLTDGMAAVTTHDENAKAAFYDPETDGLYYVREVSP